ncbi:MAG: hypothetical protein JWN21_2435 [Sphingomonas bacterium]|uniref:hypothetical protein n=1 Tax=Sphingomonas bacterium TaxID=1895847 RepID=UPI00262A0F37|nr:hypothetical protein [Sphingomonas bacterium]MDB5696892.1 hypothetical protein [Sphingomonas bacterium]
MITALLLQAALGAIGKQALPSAGCAAYLWNTGEPRQLVAMATAEPGLLRVALDGKMLDLARTMAEGAAGRGLAAVSRYAAGDVTASLELSTVERPDLRDGALAPEAMLTVERVGKDAIVMPVAGMIGCQPAR